MRWEGHETRIREMINVQRILVGKPEMGDYGVHGRIILILKSILEREIRCEGVSPESGCLDGVQGRHFVNTVTNLRIS